MLFMQELHGEIVIVFEVIYAAVDGREQVEGRAIGDKGYAFDLSQRFGGGLALLIQAAAGHQHSACALGIGHGRRNNQLRQRVAAQAHGGQLRHGLLDILQHAVRAVKHHPAAAEAADNMRFGQAVKGDAGHIGRKRGQGIVRQIIHHQAVVNLIRQQHQMMLAGNIGDSQQCFTAVYRAGGVIGVDQHDSLGTARYLAGDIVGVRIPVIPGVAVIKHRHAAANISVVAPQGVAGRGHQDFVPRAHQRRHGHGGNLADAVADKNIIHGNVLQAPALVILADYAARLGHAAHIAVGNGLVHMFGQRAAHAVGQGKAKGGRVAGIEL